MSAELQIFASNKPQIASAQKRFVKGWQLNLPDIPAEAKLCQSRALGALQNNLAILPTGSQGRLIVSRKEKPKHLHCPPS